MNFNLKKKEQVEIIDSTSNKLLKDRDKHSINNSNRRTLMNRNRFSTEIENKKLDVQKEIKRNEFECQKLQAQAKSIVEKLKLMPAKIALGKCENQINYQNIVSENRQKEIPRLIGSGKSLSIISTISAVISSFTTSAGIMGGNMLMWLFKSFVIVIASIFVNKAVKNYNRYLKDFVNVKSRVSIIIFTLLNVIIMSYTIYSVSTNYLFWSKAEFDKIGSFIFSIIFDAISLIFAFMSDDYLLLNFNSTKENKINEKIDIDAITEEITNRFDDKKKHK